MLVCTLVCFVPPNDVLRWIPCLGWFWNLQYSGIYRMLDLPRPGSVRRSLREEKDSVWLWSAERSSTFWDYERGVRLVFDC